MSRSARADVRDLHFSERLAVILLAQVVRTALELHDGHLGTLTVTHHGGEHLATLEGGLAELNLRALPDQEHLTEGHDRPGLRVELLHAQRAVLRHPILFAARGDDRVHSRIYRRNGGYGKAAHSTGAPLPGQTALSPRVTAS